MNRKFLSQNWWVLFFRGSFSVVFGIMAIFLPSVALTSLVLLFGVYALIDGGFTVYHALKGRKQNTLSGWNLLEGIISIFAGLAAWILPSLVGVTLLYVIGIYAIFTGVIQVGVAWRLRETAAREWMLGLAGVMSVVFGLLLLVYPLSGAIVIAMLIGIYAISFGLMLMAASLRYRELESQYGDNDFNAFDKTEPLPDSW